MVRLRETRIYKTISSVFCSTDEASLDFEACRIIMLAWEELRWRAASKPGDEVLVFATLLGMRPDIILQSKTC